MGKINLVRIYENKENIQNHANYKGIKLTRHSIKLWIRVIEQRLRKWTRVIDNQINFMSKRLTMKVIDRNLASVPKPIEVVKYRSHKDCFKLQ